MHIGNNNIKVDSEKVNVLKKGPKPKSVIDVWTVIGLLQLFWGFIQHLQKMQVLSHTSRITYVKLMTRMKHVADKAFEK